MSRTRQRGEVTLAAAIRRYFDVALYLLIFTGFGTLASTGRLDLPTVILVTIALLFRGYVLARRRQVLLSTRWTNLLTVLCIAFYIADEFLFSRNFLSALVHLVLFVMLIRLFSAQRDRDHYLLAALSFVMVLAAAVLTVDSMFLLALAGFILVGVAAFILMEMTHASQNSAVHGRDPQVHHAYRKLSFTVATVAPVLLVLILAGGGVIFFLLPRVSAGYLSAYSTANDLTSGFSDRVDFGRIGQIQQSKAVVMHVQVDGDSAGASHLKLRGITLDHFDGRSWENTEAKHVLKRSLDNRFDLGLPRSFPAMGSPVHYRVLMEPFLSNVFFLLQTPQFLNGGYRAVSQDTAGDVFNMDAEHPVIRYEADSVRLRIDRARLEQSGGFPPDVLRHDLQLPPLDSRIRELAETITEQESTPFEKVAVIESYLRTHYTYTLQLPAVPPRDPIANFLFDRRQGHCEYFASAMAIMLRSVGIPSRLVNGFSGGEFNDLTSQYVIRASEAHSWVDAYVPGVGWVEFDPTPPSGAQAYSRWDRLALYLDALSSFWRDWVINYDLMHQLRLTQDAGRGSRAIVGRAQFWGHAQYQRMLAWARRTEDRMGNSAAQWGMGILAVLFLVVCGFGLPRLILMVRKSRLARRPETAPQTAAGIWYQRMLRLAARRGWEKSPVQTPQEFASAIRDPRLRDKVSDFTGYYENARFGASGEDASRLPGLYEEIKSWR